MSQLLKFDIPSLTGKLTTRTWMLQRTFNWQLMIPHSINGIIGPLVSQYCQDVRFGDYSISDQSVVRYGAFQRFYGSIMGIQSATLVFIVPVDNSVYEYFREWRNLVVDSDGYYYPKNNYARTIYVCLYDRTGVQSSQFSLNGTFPRSLPRIDASYNDENIMKFEVDISVDWIDNKSVIGSIRSGITKVAGSLLGGSVKSKLGF